MTLLEALGAILLGPGCAWSLAYALTWEREGER